MDVNSRLVSLESRLAVIEDALNIKPQPTVPSTVSSQISNHQASQHHKVESSPGNWLGGIAIICFVLAAVFIIKLSIDSGWLTPIRQIGLAILLAFSLIGAGLRLFRLDKEYASLLPGAGITILYMSVFAANRIYPIISFETAVLLVSVVSALCLYLYSIIRHDVYPIASSVGAYTIPLLLSGDWAGYSFTPLFLPLNTNITPQFNFYYFLFCSLTFTTLAVWMNSRLLIVVSAYLAILLTGGLGYQVGNNQTVAMLLVIHFLIFSLGTFLYTWRSNSALTEVESWSFFPVLLLFYVFEYQFINAAYPGYAPWYSLAFAGFLLLLYLATKELLKTKANDSGLMIFSFVAIVGFHSGYLELMPSQAGPWLLVVILMIMSKVGLFGNKHDIKGNFLPIMLLLLLISSIEYLKMVAGLVIFNNTDWPAVFLSAVGIWFIFLRLSAINNDYSYAILIAAHLLVVSACYRLADPYGSLAVSALWLIYAVCVIACAFFRKDRIMVNSATIVLIFAAAKALLYDASSAPTIIRIMCLLLTGAVLYGAGFLFRKAREWKLAK